MSNSGLAAAILDFRLPVMSGRIRNSPMELLDLENVGVAVAISVISHSIPRYRGGAIFNPEVAEYVILKQVAGQRLSFNYSHVYMHPLFMSRDQF